jgi:hypothetical protein
MTDPAGGRPDAGVAVPQRRKEPTWPPAVAVLVALLLHLVLPGQLTLGPDWVIPALQALLLVPLWIAVPHRGPEDAGWVRPAGMTLIGLVTLANVLALQGLITGLLGVERDGLPPKQLLASAVVIWLTNIIIFALWYWELDGGGPGARHSKDPPLPEFLFPQIDNPSIASPGWRPRFADYLYVSITNTTAFSPTDTMPLTIVAKSLMSLQAFTSMLIIGLVVARAVNVL